MTAVSTDSVVPELTMQAWRTLSASIREPVQVKPTLENLGMNEEWLKRTAEQLERDADRNDGSDSTLYKLGHGSDDQKWVFRHSYNDPTFMKKFRGLHGCVQINRDRG
jgi:hypothetical protein